MDLKPGILVNNKLIIDNTELEYQYYEYYDSDNNNKFNPGLEQYRFKQLDNLKDKYNITEIFLNSYARNLNIYDPVICTNISNEDITDDGLRVKLNQELYNIVVNIQKYKDANKFNNNNNIIKLVNLNNNNYILESTIENITIQKSSYNRIKNQMIINKFNNINKDEFNILLWCLLYRYKKLGLLTGLQGAVLPQYYDILSKEYKSHVECFGSFINHHYKYYFGLFYDLEKYFGCLGNFFNSKLIRGFYVANPPFSVHFMNNTFMHFLKQLQNNSITIFLVLPAWVIDDRKKLNKVCKIKLPVDYENDLETNIFKNSPYTKDYILFCKEDFPYYDYSKEKIIHYTATNVIILSSKNQTINTSFLNNRRIRIK